MPFCRSCRSNRQEDMDLRRTCLPVRSSLEGCPMRIERISLVCFLSLSALSGCSANRAARSSDDSVVAPPSHQHEYSPGMYEDDRSAPPSDSPGEPVPAPPAIGVSRVKSVGWLRDLTRRKDPQSCTEDCAGQEFPIGACSAIETCAPESECVCETACEASPRKTSLFPRVGLFGRIFKHQSRQACADPCTDSGCSIPEAICEDEIACAQQPACHAPIECGEACGDVQIPHKKRHRSPDRCLADPLEDTEEHLIEHPESERAPAPEPAPAPAPVEIQTPVPGVPVIPTVPPSARRVVEPPQWPRRTAPAEAIPVPRTPQANGADGLPVVMPRNQI